MKRLAPDKNTIGTHSADQVSNTAREAVPAGILGFKETVSGSSQGAQRARGRAGIDIVALGQDVAIGSGQREEGGENREGSAQGLAKHVGLRWAREGNPDDATPRAACQAPGHCAPREAS